MALAWHLRQRDPARAQRLSAEVSALLDTLPPAEAALHRARVLLIAAEQQWLRGELDTAQYHPNKPCSCAPGRAGLAGRVAACRADACWILAWVSNDRGVSADGDRWLRQAAAAARVARSVRIDVIDAASGICDAFGDWQAAQQRWNGRFGTDLRACRRSRPAGSAISSAPAPSSAASTGAPSAT
jgi:hypothetical protein